MSATTAGSSFTVVGFLGRLELTEFYRDEVIHGIWLKQDTYLYGYYVSCLVQGYWVRPAEGGGWHWSPRAHLEARPC